jgi:cytoskeletal protein RodZ
MEYNEEPKDSFESETESDENESSNMTQWFRDNLRIIVSVFIVVVIAGGIYSYSKRSEAPATKEEVSEENILEKIAGSEDAKSQENPAVAEEKSNETQKTQPQDKISSIATSQETEKSFVETAVRGDGTTKLARRALANYLEKNPDSSLTPEHKIYIEDYLRKNVGHKGSVHIGTSVEFSKDLIAKAIGQSKTLNEKQLQNLHKYAVRVPSLS